MYKLTLALGLASSALVASQSTTTLLLLGFDTQTIDANIVGSDATATTYSLYCPSDVDPMDCGVPPSFLFTQGPSTAGYLYSEQIGSAGMQTLSVGCHITTDHGECSQTIAGQDATGIMASGTSYQYSNYATDLGAQAVTIVEGAAAPGSTGAPTVASTAAQTTGGSTGISTGSSAGSPTSSPTGSSTGKSNVSTGGMPMITGNAQWVIGGAAAAVALAAM